MSTPRKKKKPVETIINPLLQGMECQERFNLILSFTSIRSKPIIEALRRHYVDGLALELIFVDAGNFNRAKTKMGIAAWKVERIKELDGVVNGNRK